MQIRQLGRSGVSLWGLLPPDESLGAGRERFALSLMGGVTPQPGIPAGPQKMFSDGSSEFCHRLYRNLNVCGQIKSCLYCLDAVEVGGSAC